ncbi:hypothetical protein CALK_2246 [Chitinivibrio alkaliphilus ACht1]|uniref:Uncharacterized protein n=2 Tax=Chitinivibrio TaxID=1505231 RepID=U7D4L8_9BACT|nr:hypothetical protein CALK_2246 [Chitinivibrio alkaliphilus ACht1]
MAFGITRIPFHIYTGATMMGLMPLSLLLVYTGAQLSEFHTGAMDTILTPKILLPLALSGILPLIVKQVWAKTHPQDPVL